MRVFLAALALCACAATLALGDARGLLIAFRHPADIANVLLTSAFGPKATSRVC